MRRYVPALLLALATLTPLLGCDLLKSKDADAGATAAPVTTPAVTTTTTPADPATPAATTAAPLPGSPAVTPNGQPVKHADGGVVADAGKPGPTPPPPFPGFDAGLFRGFDAGGLFRGFDAGGIPHPGF